MNLKDELEVVSASKSKDAKEFNDIKEVKQLLEYNGSKEREVLRNFGLDDSIVELEKEQGRVMELEDFRNCYGNAYQYAAIRELAIRYRMKFLPLSKYKGAIDPLLAAKILEFGKAHNIDVASTGVQDDFYVLAPAEAFKLETYEHVHITRKIIPRDPLLFYKGGTKNNNNRDGQLWTLVHQWGKDLTIGRLLYATPFRNRITFWFFNLLVAAAVLSVALTGFIATFMFNAWSIAAVCLLPAALYASIRNANVEKDEESNIFSESGWSDGRYHVVTKRTVIEYV